MALHTAAVAPDATAAYDTSTRNRCLGGMGGCACSRQFVMQLVHCTRGSIWHRHSSTLWTLWLQKFRAGRRLTMYSDVATNSTAPRHSSGRSYTSTRRPSGPSWLK